MPTSVADVLALPVMLAGEPEVLSARHALGRRVRWAHVSELPDIGPLLRGEELILTTGVALPQSAAGLREFVTTLHEANACALVIELGRRFAEIPASIVDTAEQHGLPVIALRRPVRFVSVTEEVHSLIVEEQHELLRMSQDAHLEFTRMSIEGASVQRILDTLAEMAGQAVVLEDLAHRAVAYACRPGAAGELLDGWEDRSRLVELVDETAVRGPQGWLLTPVGPRSHRWGRLVAPTPTGPQPQLAMLLERAGEALAINRLLERDLAGLVHQAHRGLLFDLVSGRVTDATELRARAEALGLPTGRARLLGIAVQAETPRTLDPLAAESRDRSLAEAVTHAVQEVGLPALVATVQTGQALVLAALPSGRPSALVLGRLAERLDSRLRSLAWSGGHAIGVGREVTAFAAATDSLREAAHVAEAGLALAPTQPRAYYLSTDVRLRGLLSLLRDDPRLSGFAEAELGRLVEHDARHSTDLVGTLRHYFAAGANKSTTARTTHLSRPALYARLATIERVLGVPLDEPESATALNLALLIRDATLATGRPPPREMITRA